jgi:hypothetical protein
VRNTNALEYWVPAFVGTTSDCSRVMTAGSVG